MAEEQEQQAGEEEQQNQAGQESEDEGAAMSLVDHLEELRRRIIISLLAIGIAAGVSYAYIGRIMQVIVRPVGKLVFLSPAEAFFTYLKVSFFVGFMLALPVVVHQVWCFVLPALNAREKQAARLLVPAAVLLFFSGVGFGYHFVLPAAIRFFLGFATEQLQPLLSLGAYLSFVISFLLPFGLIFELPLVILVLASLGLIRSEFLRKQRKIVIIGAFVVGAIVSPTPDIFSQTMIAVPLLVLYEVSILLTKHVLRK